ncbi:amino acid-binding protein [Thiovibrio sp. JS02]
MHVQQLIASLPSDAEAMAEIADLLAQHCINIRALSLTECDGRCVLRLIVNDAGKARQLFEQRGFPVMEQEVLVIEVPDKPGGLASVLQAVKSIRLKLEFLDAFTRRSGQSGLIILRFQDLDAAARALAGAGIKCLSGEQLYAS